MSMTVNGTSPTSVNYNGSAVEVIVVDGVEVWRSHPSFLVRMRYDANESTHVKDLVGGYTITTNTGGAVPAAADPFGGNAALNLSDIWIKYDGSKGIQALTSTMAFWVKLDSLSYNNAVWCVGENNSTAHDRRIVQFIQGKPTIIADMASEVLQSDAAISANAWHYIEINTDNSTARFFIDGVLQKTVTSSVLSTNNVWKFTTSYAFIGQADWDRAYTTAKLHGSIYDFCILNGVWHTNNYVVPTGYI